MINFINVDNFTSAASSTSLEYNNIVVMIVALIIVLDSVIAWCVCWGRGGGAQLVPTLPWDTLRNFVQAKVTKVAPFPETYLETIWCDMSTLIKSDVAMATIF